MGDVDWDSLQRRLEEREFEPRRPRLAQAEMIEHFRHKYPKSYRALERIEADFLEIQDGLAYVPMITELVHVQLAINRRLKKTDPRLEGIRYFLAGSVENNYAYVSAHIEVPPSYLEIYASILLNYWTAYAQSSGRRWGMNPSIGP